MQASATHFADKDGTMRQWLRLVSLTILVASFTLTAVLDSSLRSEPKPTEGRGDHGSPQSNETPDSIPAYHRSEKEAKPFPALLPPSRFGRYPVVKRAYEIAHEIPGVLAQQPCYCRCDKHFGHTSLLDCYTSDHTAGCMTCLKETYFVYQMTKQGKKPAAIRAAIIHGDWRDTNVDQPTP